MGATQALLLCMALGEAASLLVPWSLHADTLAVPVLIVHQLIGDALLTMFLIQAVSLRQQILPPGVLGRASASFHVVTGPAARRRARGRPAGERCGPASDAVGRRHRWPARRAGVVAGDAVHAIAATAQLTRQVHGSAMVNTLFTIQL